MGKLFFYCFSRSFVKFQGHAGRKVLDPILAFADDHPDPNSQATMECTQSFERHIKMCIIVFQDHPSHFKDTEQTNSLGLSQLSNLSDFPFYNQYHFILYFILLSFPIKIIIPIICPVKSERIWSIESGCKNTEVNLKAIQVLMW